MRFAVRAPTSNKVAGRSAVVDVAQAAEELGFYAVSVHDHLVFNGWWVACGAKDAVGEGDDRDMYEALTVLSFVAGKTERIRLMTAILLLSVREPVLAAKQVATLDALSDGRVLLGIGIGSRRSTDQTTSANELNLGAHADNAEKEYQTFKTPPGRGRMANEYLQAFREIWTAPSANFDGEFVQFRDIEVYPKPVQPGGPPILVGGRSPQAMRRTVAYGDGWLPNSISPQSYAEGVADLRRRAEAMGKPPPAYFGLNIFSHVADTDEQAIDILQPTLGNRFSREQVILRNLGGSPETVVRRIREYEDVGVNLIELKPIYRSVSELVRMLELISREVMPAFESDVAVRA